MTVGIVVKVWDGIVLAADSATTIELANGQAHVYNSANKVFHLHRRLPVAAMTWGLGNIGPASIATLAKDLRTRLMGHDTARPTWELDPDAYTIEEVAGRVVEHLHGELYAQAFGGQPAPHPEMGMLVAGFSAGEHRSEAWLVEFRDATVTPVPVEAVPKDASGWVSYAQPEATQRLWMGIDRQAEAALMAGLTPAELQKVVGILNSAGIAKLPFHPAMPLADAIALAQFMVEVTSGYTHFLLGPNTVGGPTEVASMSRHEGFRWIHRKHYYTPTLNPREPDHAS